MKLVFVGPSLHGVTLPIPPELELRPPAAKGDVSRAVEEGADVIGLVDGYFETTAAVWHKEILYALTRGTRVFGAASIGALRAAECAAFGMVGVGAIYEAYAAGRIEDDAEVALLHAPGELGYAPLSEPMVNVRATLGYLRQLGVVGERQAAALLETASSIFYKERTWAAIVARSALPLSEIVRLGPLIQQHRVDQKRLDAQALLAVVARADEGKCREQTAWELSQTSYLRAITTQR